MIGHDTVPSMGIDATRWNRFRPAAIAQINSKFGRAVRSVLGRVAIQTGGRGEPGVGHRPSDIAAFHFGALGVHAHDDACPSDSAGYEGDGVAGAEIRLGGLSASARVVAFGRTRFRRCAESAGGRLPGGAVARPGSGEGVGDLVQDGVGDLLGPAVDRVCPAEQDELLPRAAFAQLLQVKCGG